MRGIRPAQGFIAWLTPPLLNPDLACASTGMGTSPRSRKAPKVLGSFPQLWPFQRRPSRKQEGPRLPHQGGQNIRAAACEPKKSDLGSVLLSCPNYLRWRTTGRTADVGPRKAASVADGDGGAGEGGKRQKKLNKET